MTEDDFLFDDMNCFGVCCDTFSILPARTVLGVPDVSDERFDFALLMGLEEMTLLSRFAKIF